MNKIFIIEDDEGIREYIKELLTDNAYIVHAFADGITALEFLKKTPADLVILDLGLPRVQGEAICRDIKKRYPQTPVIILTAKDTTTDIVNGLNIGADDYVTKPFVGEVLLARIKARLRAEEEAVISIDDLQINTKKVEVTRANKKIKLSSHEFKLLTYLLKNKDRVLTREMILNKVWQYSYDIDTRVVDVYIGYLRKKIDSGFKRKLIQSIRGFGYVVKGE